MGIKQIQINRAVEKIIKHYLFNGRYPTFQTITHHISQWLQEHTPGVPTFRPIKAKRKEESDSKSYNQNIQMIYTDISDGYTATIEQTKRVMKNFNFIETEREKIRHELKKLSNTIDELLLTSGNGDFKYLDNCVIGFEDLHYIDQLNSTIMVDITHQQVTLKENISKTKKILINGENATFHTLMPVEKSEALESIQNAFDDNVNTTWWQVVKTKTPGSIETESSMGMRAELTILFDQEEEFNEISYVAHHGNPVYIKIEYTLDGSSFTPLPDKNNNRKVTSSEIWQFEKIKAKGVKFIFEKKEHDDNSAGVYQYYFGAKDISIYNRSFLPEGILYTSPIEFDHTIRQLSIDTKDEIPVNTTLEYEVALYDENKRLEELTWYPISPIQQDNPKYAKVIEFNTKNIRTVEAEKAEATGQIINGMQVFRLVKDNGDGIITEIMTDVLTGKEKETFDVIKNAQLFRGINQWRRERCYVPFTGSVPVNSLWTQQFEERPHTITIDYLPISNTLDLTKKRGGGINDNFYRFTTCIYSEESKSYPLSLSVIQTTDSGIRKRLGVYSVYVNKERLISTNDEVVINLNQGWNEIQILYHWGDMQNRTDLPSNQLPTETYLGKFNFSRQLKVRADLEPLTYIDYHSLYYNISPNNRDHFSIYEQQIVLNYLPTNCIFQLTYEADVKDKKPQQIILRAKMSHIPDVIDITPKIYRMNIQAV